MSAISDHSGDAVRIGLQNYMAESKLSMNQVAKKLNVSSPMLSQIKNGKKKPSLELGLKILSELGCSFDEKREWVFDRCVQESPEAEKIKESLIEKENEKRIKNGLIERMENDSILVNVFLDISLASEDGLHWSEISKDHGEHGIDLAKELIESGMVRFQEGRYYIVHSECRKVFDEIASFGLMKRVFADLKAQAAKNAISYEFVFELSDVDKQGFEKLRELAKDYREKAKQIIDEHELSRKKGGYRIVSQQIVSSMSEKVKSILVWALIPMAAMFLQLQPAEAKNNGIQLNSSGNGIIGGGSANRVNTTRTLNFRGDKYKWMEVVVRASYWQKEHARTQAVATINAFRQGVVDDSFDRYFRHPRRADDDCNTGFFNGPRRRGIVELMSQGNVAPKAFTIQESFDSNTGNPIYTYNLPVTVPCFVGD
ncbi:MAG: helix-turn-helix transcriptional regulator [Bdellovibrionales bacterium]|nr:helix-turn-helix transcriptional regulator [Bdellovibrionales bacterium]